jgi:hypothetical protein
VHQLAVAHLVAALGEAKGATDILAAVTRGGGKSHPPVIAVTRLIEPRNREKTRSSELTDNAGRRHTSFALAG